MSLTAWGDFTFLIGIFIAVFCLAHAAQLWLERRERRQSALDDPPVRRSDSGFIGVDINPCLAGRQAPTRHNNRFR